MKRQMYRIAVLATVMTGLVVSTGAQAELILHYTFDDHIDGATIEDESNSSSQTNDAAYGSGNTANIGPVVDSIRGRQVLYVAGAHEIAVANTGNGIAAADNFTVSGWYKGTDDGYFFDQEIPRFVIKVDADGSVDVYYDGTWYEDSVTGASVKDGEWHHIAVVIDHDGVNAVFSTYIDGVAQDVDAAVGVQTSKTMTGKGKASLSVQGTNYRQRFCASYSGASGLIGLFDDLRVYDTSLSGAAILGLYESTLREEGAYVEAVRNASPLEVFRLASSAAENGSAVGGAQWTHGSTNGLQFTAAGGFLGLGNGNTWADVVDPDRDYWNGAPVTTANLGAGSVVAWINPHFTGDGTQVFMFGQGVGGSTSVNGDKVINMYLRDDGDLGFAVDTKFMESASVLDTSTDRWFMVAATWDQSSSEAKLYLDGQPINSFTSAWGDTVALNYFYMGHEPSGSTRSYNGYIDEVAIWTNVLSASAIRELYDRAVKGPARGTVVAIR